MPAETESSRSEQHAQVGDALREAAGNEWAAVCYFYAAYHLATSVIRTDPVFDDPDRLHRLNSALIPEDRHTSRHQGRKHGIRSREWGVNELMVLLYDQPIAAAYDKLHRASIEVRYESGLRAPVVRTREWLSVIQEAAARGEMVCQKGR